MRYTRIFIALFLCVAVLFTAFIGRYKIDQPRTDTSAKDYKGVLSVWHVDSFEGGTGSRKQFLLKASRSFEQKHDGVLVMVSTYTAEGIKDSLSKGIYPDMISFGAGVTVSGFSELNLKRESEGGKVGGRTYAAAWCRGGYVLISNPKLADGTDDKIDKIIVSQSDYTQPLSALLLEGLSVQEVEVKSPMDAYVKFVGGKVKYFLGTQRDVVRLTNRGFEFTSRPLIQYNDLYQYISVTSKDQVKRYYSELFVEHILSDQVQTKLTEIAMFSDFIELNYDNEHLNNMQGAKKFSTVSAFSTAENLHLMQENALMAVSGNEEAINKIKNMLI